MRFDIPGPRTRGGGRATIVLVLLSVASSLPVAWDGAAVAKAGPETGYRACASPAGVCSESAVLGAPVTLDIDGDGVPDVAADLGPVDPTMPGEVGTQLHGVIVRLAPTVNQHVHLDVVVQGTAQSLRLGVDGQDGSIPARAAITLTAAEDGAEDSTVVAMSSRATAPAGPWGLTMAVGEGEDALALEVVDAPTRIDGHVTTANSEAEQVVEWIGDPLGEVHLDIVTSDISFAGRLTDVPAEMRMVLNPDTVAGSLSYSASTSTLDVEADLRTEDGAVELLVEDLAADTTIRWSRNTSPYVDIDGTDETGVIAVALPLERRIDRENDVRGVTVRVIADIDAPSMSVRMTDVRTLTISDHAATLRFAGSYSRVAIDLGEDLHVTHRTCWRRICGAEKTTDRLDSHRFTPGWRVESTEETTRCNPLTETPKKVWHHRTSLRPAWRGVLAATTSFAVTGGTQWILLLAPGELNDPQVRWFVADDHHGSGGSMTETTCEV